MPISCHSIYFYEGFHFPLWPNFLFYLNYYFISIKTTDLHFYHYYSWIQWLNFIAATHLLGLYSMNILLYFSLILIAWLFIYKLDLMDGQIRLISFFYSYTQLKAQLLDHYYWLHNTSMLPNFQVKKLSRLTQLNKWVQYPASD